MEEIIKAFRNEQFGEIRTLEIEGKPYFVASDIAKALGYKRPNDAISAHCRWAVKHSIPHPQSPSKAMEVNVIPQGDVVRLASHSELPGAEKFESWIYDEVIPTVMKHGMYATDELVANPDLLIQVATALKEERERNKELEGTVQQMDKVICEMTPKADYADRILSSTDCMTITQIAQDYGYAAKTFNRILASACIQRCVGGQWILYADHQGKGYVRTKVNEYTKKDGTTGTKPLTVWTQKGRMFLYQRLKNIGIEPDMERNI